ncbi:hypothetical protein ACS0TY_004488 [Phlomoides rotata]
MRTRFLPTDYSTTTATATATATATGGGCPIETLDFVRLPLPDLPPPLFSAYFLHSFDEIPAFGISLEIEKLPIDDALSIFLSDVLPHFVDGAGFEEPRIDSDKAKHEDKDRTAFSNKGGYGHIFVEFEIPEMDVHMLPLKSDVSSQSECLLSEVPEAELTMDLLNSNLTLRGPAEIQQLLYSVDDIRVEYQVEQKPDLLEDADSVNEKLHFCNIKFPVFEVDMESLGVLGRTNMIDELLNFEYIEKQQVMQPDGGVSYNKELLGSIDSDWIKYLFHHSVQIPCLEDTKNSSQLDLISIIELSRCQQYSTLQGNQDVYSTWSVGPFMFVEFMFLDLDLYHFCGVFSDSAKKIEAETCEDMFGEAMNFRSFSQLIVCHELTLMDNSIKSLPIPIFSDQGTTSSLHTLVDELLTELDWQSSSASDGLYLDWHLLEGDDSASTYYSSSSWEIDTCNVDVNMNSSDCGKLIFDFILSEGHSRKPDAENYKEILNLSCDDVSISHPSEKADLSCLKNCGDGERLNDDVLLKTGGQKAPVFGESMSSDLDFFLNPRNYVIGKENIPADKSVDTKTVCQLLVSTVGSVAANSTTVVQQKWNVKMRKVQLSDNILLLIDYLWKNFLALLENDKELVQLQNQYKASNDLMLLYLPLEKLKNHLQERIATDASRVHNSDDILVIAMLCAIKQMGFYLCYYGIQATYLYMDKLSSSLECVKSRLSFLYNLLRDENQKAEKELSGIHPSISVVKEILQSNLSYNNSKILIVSDHVFWWPLKRLLTSLKISCKELKHPFNPPSQQQHCCGMTGSIADVMLYSDCCLVSHECISASFPFSEFSIILEYGGSNVSSRISSTCPNSDGLPTLYFLMVELVESSIAKALLHGVNMPSTNLERKRDMNSAPVQKKFKTKLEVLLNTIPVMETYGNEPVEAVNEESNMMPLQSMPVGLESKHNISCKPFGHNTVIVVNTRNFNEEMIISRRGTYQRILDMEHEGAQVVERDVGLPVDVIVSSSVCLTWHDCRNIEKKASAPDEAFSCLPLCVESIAASILTSLSFAFSCCILIFEGDCNFLCSIMESSDELYAAAASLGIDIQLFCSYSMEMTEEIILSCINVAAKLTTGIYPKMSDSESLAESFLAAFPSINPLSAHAILSTNATLGEFLELSNRGKSCALQKFQVPDESIALLSVISRYGEREDSKSGLTDCSSSLSVPNSENVQFKSASRKKPKYTHELYDAGEPPNDLFSMDSQKLLPDDEPQQDLPNLSVSCNPWLSGSTEILKSQQFSLSFNDKLPSHTQDIDDDMVNFNYADIMKSIDKSSLHDFPLAKGLQISDEREKPWMPQFDIDCSPRWKSATTLKNNFNRQSTKATGILQGSSTGEVIDLEDTPAFREKFFVANSSSFSPNLLDVEKDYSATNSRMNKRPSSATNLPIFTNPIETHAASGARAPRIERRRISKEEIKPQFVITNRNNMSMAREKGFLEEDVVEVPQNSYKQSFQEKGTQSFGGTRLSNAVHSAQPQGSPWTIEFLNRIREKSRLRNQSVSCNLSSPSFGSFGNTSKVTKRKSPSILEFYKYKGGSAPQRVVEEKRRKRFSRPLDSSKTKKASAPFPSSLTPVDKTARQTLSFSTNGSGGQSKLVWRDNDNHTTQRRW